MTTAPNKICASLMAIVVLFSTLSFTLNMHYCGDTLVEIALLSKAKGCGMKMDKPSSESCTITQKNRCEDKQLSIEGQNELQLQVHKISFKQQVFIASFVNTYITLFNGDAKDINFFREYKPPLVVKQIFKIDETYLI